MLQTLPLLGLGGGSCTWVNDVGLEGCEEHGAEPHSCVHTSNNLPFAEKEFIYCKHLFQSHKYSRNATKNNNW